MSRHFTGIVSEFESLPSIEMVVKSSEEKFSDRASTPLFLESYHIHLSVKAGQCQTTHLMTFLNLTPKVLEGELVFPLGKDCSIHMFGLDINGEIVDAVPIEKEKARVAFETTVREKGPSVSIAEQVDAGGNTFKTRVYPMPPNGRRTVKIVVINEMIDEKNCKMNYLSLSKPARLKELSYSVDSNECTIFTRSSSDGSIKEVSEENAISATSDLEGILLVIPKNESFPSVHIEKDPDSGYHFFSVTFSDLGDLTQQGKKIEGVSKIGIYYDVSLSRKKSEWRQELKLMKSYLEKCELENKLIEISVRTFSCMIHEERTFLNTSDTIEFLGQQHFDGGTNLPIAEIARNENGDQVTFLLSDGVTNFGKSLEHELFDLTFSTPIFCLSSSPTSSYIILRYIGNQSGGGHLDLFSEKCNKSVVMMANKLSRQRTSLQRVVVEPKESVKEIQYPSEIVNNSMTVYGILTDPESCPSIQLDFGNDRFSRKEEISILKYIREGESTLIRTLWAQQKIQRLSVFPTENEKEIHDVGIRFGIVTPGTSLIVLEELAQYEKYSILPPRQMKEMRKKYLNNIKLEEEKDQNRAKKKVESVVSKWERRIEWHKRDFEPPPPPPPPPPQSTETNLLQRKLVIPVDEHPDYNFVGLILGPRGSTQRRLEAETGAKISIRGSLNSQEEPLHVLITSENVQNLTKAVEVMEKLLVPIEEGRNEFKRQQLRELARIHGTLRGEDEGDQPCPVPPSSSPGSPSQLGRTNNNTSSSGWGQIEGRDTEWIVAQRRIGAPSPEKPEGNVTDLFKQIYNSGDEETRKSMIKSLQESGGTVLSTNWKEVNDRSRPVPQSSSIGSTSSQPSKVTVKTPTPIGEIFGSGDLDDGDFQYVLESDGSDQFVDEDDSDDAFEDDGVDFSDGELDENEISNTESSERGTRHLAEEWEDMRKSASADNEIKKMYLEELTRKERERNMTKNTDNQWYDSYFVNRDEKRQKERDKARDINKSNNNDDFEIQFESPLTPAEDGDGLFDLDTTSTPVSENNTPIFEDDEEEGEGLFPTTSKIQVKVFEPGAEYLHKIRDSDNKYEEYLKQREFYESSPSFYLDCSDYFLSLHTKKTSSTRKEEEEGEEEEEEEEEEECSDDSFYQNLGVRILSNIVELELNNAQLFRIIGYRLDQAKRYEDAIHTFEKVLKEKPEEPQSYRDLALVLEKMGDLERSAELLYDVIKGSWDDRFDGIELTAAIELNHVLRRMNNNLEEEVIIKKLGIHPKLIYRMHCAIRVSMAWDTDMTDIDLHVYDPSGEHCFYSHRETKAGGFISRDFTRGYGPEEFMQKNVWKSGKFKVTAKYFASHQQSLTGGTTILCSFFTNYLLENEKGELITLRLNTSKEEISVCEIDFCL